MVGDYPLPERSYSGIGALSEGLDQAWRGMLYPSGKELTVRSLVTCL